MSSLSLGNKRAKFTQIYELEFLKIVLLMQEHTRNPHICTLVRLTYWLTTGIMSLIIHDLGKKWAPKPQKFFKLDFIEMQVKQIEVLQSPKKVHFNDLVLILWKDEFSLLQIWAINEREKWGIFSVYQSGYDSLNHFTTST